MRKLIVGLMVVGLLAVAAPAMALDTGMGDPLGLISSGAVIPYVGGGSQQSWLEVSSPVGNSGGFHMFFFDTSCARQGPSLGLPMTINDVDVIRIDNRGNPTTGLIAAATIDQSGFNLEPLRNPVHARVYWVTSDGFVRVLEPISVDHGEFPGLILTWNPLRTGASFFAPLEVASTHTTLLLICPTTNITANNSATAAFPTSVGSASGSGFPELVPQPFGAAGSLTPLQARVYNDEEKFLRDIHTTCQCLTSTGVLQLDAVYGDPDPVIGGPFGTFTEIEGSEAAGATPHAFTGYKAIRVGGNNAQGGVDAFGRLDNANIKSQQGGNGTAQR
jgi:hypothetical protein